MKKSQFLAAEWWVRRRFGRIRKILDQFPDMGNPDGEILAGCLATLLRGQELTPDQEARCCCWWWRWFSDVDTAAKRQRRGQTLVEKVEAALATLCLSKFMRAELTNALERLQNGGRMSPCQAGLWGTHVLPMLRLT
jgi:hypothetical protein